mgnify:CR=1 FL=1
MNGKDIVALCILFSSFIVFIIWVLIVIHSIKLTTRLENHTIKTKKSETISFIDRIINYYQNFKKNIANNIIKLIL